MPIFDIVHRVVKISGTAMPRFPAEVTVHAQLAPKEVFGEEVLSGRLQVFPPGQRLRLQADMWHGGMRRVPIGRLPRVEATCPFFDLSLRLEGSLASIEGRMSNEGSFKRCIHVVAADLGAVLSSVVQGPVSVCEVYGTVGEQGFKVEVRGTFEDVVKTLDVPASAREKMSRMVDLPADGADRVFAALRYLNHARWLAYAASFPAQFAGEQLLNLNKALEVLLPHADIDGLRRTLRTLGLRAEVVELLASLGHVRNQVDVGHGAIELLSEREHRDLHRFVLYAVELVGWLVDHIVGLAAEGTFTIQPHEPDAKKKRDSTLARMGDLLDKVNPLQPSTFLNAGGADEQANPIPSPKPRTSKKGDRQKGHK